MRVKHLGRLVCLFVSCALGSVACGSDDGGGGTFAGAGAGGTTAGGGATAGGGTTGASAAGNTGGVPPGEAKTLVDYYAAGEQRERAWCKYYDECCVPEDEDSYTRIFCPKTIVSAEEEAADTEKAIAAGEYGFDGRYVDACLADRAALLLPVPESCSGPLGPAAARQKKPGEIRDLAQSAACRQMFPGKKKEGEKCSTDIGCALGLACREVAGNYQCAKPGAKGEACDVLDSDCAKGLSCIGKRCLAEQTIGGSCQSAENCAEGLTCGFPDGARECVSAKGVGADCKDDLEACEEGLFCSFSTTKCTKFAPVGASCDLGCGGRCDKKTNKCTTVCGGTFF